MKENKKYKIVLSFGAAEGGVICAGWLQGIIASELNISKDDIYFDVITLLDAPETKLEMSLPKNGIGSGGMKPVNPLWREHYKGAMTHADWMIFIITKEWIKSNNCIQELEWFGEQVRKKSAPSATQKLDGLAIFLDNIHTKTHITNKFSYSGIRTLNGSRHYLAPSKRLRAASPSLRVQWILNDECKNNLIDILKSRYGK